MKTVHFCNEFVSCNYKFCNFYENRKICVQNCSYFAKNPIDHTPITILHSNQHFLLVCGVSVCFACKFHRARVLSFICFVLNPPIKYKTYLFFDFKLTKSMINAWSQHLWVDKLKCILMNIIKMNTYFVLYKALPQKFALYSLLRHVCKVKYLVILRRKYANKAIIGTTY